MVETDENTRYSLRLLGRGSLLLVSVALVVAIIGYLKRDEPYINEETSLKEVYTPEELFALQGNDSRQLMNRKITIAGVMDSINRENGRIMVFFKEDSTDGLLKCSFPEKKVEREMAPGGSYNVQGLFRGRMGNVLLLDNCSLQDQ
ncbi:MAG: hypothetical protein R6U19_05425 [Bacteroidales bacterium]